MLNEEKRQLIWWERNYDICFYLRKIEVFVVGTGGAIDAGGGVSEVGVGASHGVDELSSDPLPGDVPVIQASQRVVVVYGHLGQVVSWECLDDVVWEG